MLTFGVFSTLKYSILEFYPLTMHECYSKSVILTWNYDYGDIPIHMFIDQLRNTKSCFLGLKFLLIPSSVFWGEIHKGGKKLVMSVSQQGFPFYFLVYS